ncbi:hypothetical protein LLEC1_04235 [Akanthomyces lecanii]|uniref:Uncharacterized protein n=1 Tax=Cordyceps confragosa TaxID=2714763 RepID=A0A179I3Z4_CORDF|nr:hypothetical protein LLEC1_04235 [Akanthomyces lecanii]
MARTKQTARRSVRALITLTRFYLPPDQEWPVWSVEEGGDPHAGPLDGVEGAHWMRIGRLIDDPEQAVYIIDWSLLHHFKAFQSSPACAEFLRNLPESKKTPASTIPGAEMQQLTLDDDVSLSPPGSRFLLLKDCTETCLRNFYQIITLTTFSVPGTLDSNTWPQLFKPLREKFRGTMPSGPHVTNEHPHNWRWTSNAWFMALEEDSWAAEKFGTAAKREGRAGDDASSHAIFCHIYLWKGFSNPRKQEAAAAADPGAAEKRQRALAKTKPPATAHVQERWAIRSIPSWRMEEDVSCENADEEKEEEEEEDEEEAEEI